MSIETAPAVIALADVVVTVGPVVAMSIKFPLESKVEIVNEEEVPMYLKLVIPGTFTVMVERAETFEAKNPLKKIVVPFGLEQGGFEEDVYPFIEHPLLAVAAASDIEIPLGKSIQMLPPDNKILDVVNVNVYSVFGFEATELFIPIKVGVIVLGVMTNIEVLIT